MKYFYVLLFCISFLSCSPKESTKLEAFSMEAFAYDLGDGWEVNASVRVKGFTQIEDANKYNSLLDYSVDLSTPGGETKEAVYRNVFKKQSSEKLIDIPLEIQFELDTTYNTGKYFLIIKIKDNNSNQSISVKKEFELGNE
jgi:hypothetical protein